MKLNEQHHCHKCRAEFKPGKDANCPKCGTDLANDHKGKQAPSRK